MTELYFKQHIFCCENKRENDPRGCCADKGASHLRDYMKKRCKELGLKGIRVNTAGCLDRCALGPVMVIYPEGIWYNFNTESDVDEIIAIHLQNGKHVERLQLSIDRKKL